MTIHGGSSDWLVVFGDSWMAQSAIDRFRNNAYDVVIEGESYRPRLKPKNLLGFVEGFFWSW